MHNTNTAEETNTVATGACAVPCTLSVESIKELTSSKHKTVLVTLKDPIIAPDGKRYNAVFGTLVSDASEHQVFKYAVVIGDGTPVFVHRKLIRSMIVTTTVSAAFKQLIGESPFYIADRIVDAAT